MNNDHVYSTSDCWAAIDCITKPMWEQAIRHKLFPVLVKTNPYSGEGKAPIHGDNAYTNCKGERIPSRQEFYDSNPLVNGGWKGRYKNNVAIECGLRSNIVVIDIDVKPGNNGLADWLAKIKANTPFVSIRAFNEAHNGPIVETPSGGLHYWFRYDQEVGLTHKYKSPNSDIYDVQVDGKLVTFPGSVYMGCMSENWKTLKWSKPKHKCSATLPQGVEGCLFRGRKYKWVEDHSIDEKPLCEMPSWMKAFFIKEKPRAARMQEPTVLETGHAVFDKIIPLLAPLAGGGKYSAWTRTLWILTSLGASQDQCHEFSKLGGAAYDNDATQRILNEGSTIQHHVNSLVNLVREAQTQISDQEEKFVDVDALVEDVKKQLDLAECPRKPEKSAEQVVEDKSFAAVKARFEEEASFITEKNSYLVKQPSGQFVFLSREQMKTRYENLSYEEEVRNRKTNKWTYEEKPFLEQWFKSATKLTHDNAGCYPPALKKPASHKNMWAGMAVEHWETTPAARKEVKHIIEHLSWCCSGDVAQLNYVLTWFAHIFQCPGQKPNVMLCFHSFVEGTGKSVIGELIQEMIGQKHSVKTMQDSITKNFNAVLWNKIFVQLDEVNESILSAKERQRMLDVITCRTDSLEPKGKEIIQQTSLTRFFATSNVTNGFYVAENERRRFVLQTPNELRHRSIYDRLYSYLQNEAVLRAFYDFLMEWRHPDHKNTPISQFNFMERPYSEYQEESRLHSRDRELEFIIDYVSNEPEEIIPLTAGKLNLYGEFKAWMEPRNPQYQTSDKSFGLKIAKIIGMMKDKSAFTKKQGTSGSSKGCIVYEINAEKVIKDFEARGIMKKQTPIVQVVAQVATSPKIEQSKYSFDPLKDVWNGEDSDDEEF